VLDAGTVSTNIHYGPFVNRLRSCNEPKSQLPSPRPGFTTTFNTSGPWCAPLQLSNSRHIYLRTYLSTYRDVCHGHATAVEYHKGCLIFKTDQVTGINMFSVIIVCGVPSVLAALKRITTSCSSICPPYCVSCDYSHYSDRRSPNPDKTTAEYELNETRIKSHRWQFQLPGKL
jgi:hypothetical protein